MLLQCKWLYDHGKPTPLTEGFAAAWCGIGSKHVYAECMHWLRRHGYLRYVGRERGSKVFLPGEGG